MPHAIFPNVGNSATQFVVTILKRLNVPLLQPMQITLVPGSDHLTLNWFGTMSFGVSNPRAASIPQKVRIAKIMEKSPTSLLS